MTKFHINAKGVPAPCRATQGNCPFGGDDGKQNHFDTFEEAEAVANERYSEKHSLLPTVEDSSDDSEKQNDTPNGTDKVLPDLVDELADEKGSSYNESREEQEESEERVWYIYADGTHSNEVRENETPVSSSNDWLSAVVEIAKVNEARFSEIKGVDPSVNSQTMTVEEQESYYLAQEEIAEGVKKGPHRSYNNRKELKALTTNYLGGTTENSLSFDKAQETASLQGRDSLILGKGRRARGLAGLLGKRTYDRGVVLKRVVVRGEGDEGKRDSQLPKLLEIEYLDEKGVRSIMSEYERAAREGWGTHARASIFYHGNARD